MSKNHRIHIQRGIDGIDYAISGDHREPTIYSLNSLYFQLNKTTEVGEFDYMAKSRKPKGVSDFELISFKLTAEEKKQFNTWQKDNASKLNEMIETVLGDGYKLGVSWDDYNQCFVASLYGKDEEGKNYKSTLLGRSDDWQEAFLVVMFKHFVVFEQLKWEGRDERDNFG